MYPYDSSLCKLCSVHFKQVLDVVLDRLL